MTDEELRKLKAELDELQALRDNLTATQNRCSALLTENRKLKSHLATMRLRWIQLLEMQGWENGPDEDTCVFTYKLDYNQDRTYIIERDVNPPTHRCVTDGHSYGHGDTCHYCGHNDDDEVIPLDTIKVKDEDIETE